MTTMTRTFDSLEEFYHYLDDVYRQAILDGKTHAQARTERREAQIKAEKVEVTTDRSRRPVDVEDDGYLTVFPPLGR